MAVVSPGVQPKRRGLLRHPLVRITGSAIILALLFFVLPFDEMRDAFLRVSWWVWPIALAIYLSLHLIGVAKWRLLINVAGAGLSFRQAARAYYSGLFGNTFLPSIVGGDVVRAGVALRAAKSKSGLVLGSMVDRLQDIVGLALVAGIGALLSPRALDAQSRGIFITLGGALAAVGLVGVLAIALVPVRRFPFKVRRKLVSVRRALRATAGNPAALVTALTLGVMLQGLLVVLNYWLGLTIGIDIPLYVWLFVWPLAKIAGLLPVTQGGIGVREAAQAVLFAPFGVSAAKAVATGLVFEVVIIAGGLVGGGVAVLLRDARDRASGSSDGGRERLVPQAP
jgi:glycosyltransferase 2 family protein